MATAAASLAAAEATDRLATVAAQIATAAADRLAAAAAAAATTNRGDGSSAAAAMATAASSGGGGWPRRRRRGCRRRGGGSKPLRPLLEATRLILNPSWPWNNMMSLVRPSGTNVGWHRFVGRGGRDLCVSFFFVHPLWGNPFIHAFRETMKASCCCCCCCRCMRACVRARACARVREREYACVSERYVHVRPAARASVNVSTLRETVSSDTFSFRTIKNIETASTDSVSSKGTRTIRSVCQLLQRTVGTWHRAP